MVHPKSRLARICAVEGGLCLLERCFFSKALFISGRWRLLFDAFVKGNSSSTIVFHSFAFYAAVAGPGPTSGGPLPIGPGNYPTLASESRTLSFIYTSPDVQANPMQTSSVACSFRHILVHTIKAKSSKQSISLTVPTNIQQEQV